MCFSFHCSNFMITQYFSPFFFYSCFHVPYKPFFFFLSFFSLLQPFPPLPNFASSLFYLILLPELNLTYLSTCFYHQCHSCRFCRSPFSIYVTIWLLTLFAPSQLFLPPHPFFRFTLPGSLQSILRPLSKPHRNIKDSIISSLPTCHFFLFYYSFLISRFFPFLLLSSLSILPLPLSSYSLLYILSPIPFIVFIYL